MRNNIFIGYYNRAGIGLSLKEGFEKNNYNADLYTIDDDFHKYQLTNEDANVQINIKLSGNPIIKYFQILSHFIKIIIKYKYFIYISGSDGYLLSEYKDVKFLKLLNKKIAVIFTGCDVRIPESVKKYKWNPCTDCTDSYKKTVGCDIAYKIKYIESLEKNFDNIFCPAECSGYIKKEYHDIKFPVKEPKLKFENNGPQNGKLRILHAPSNEDYKGSRYIYSVIDKLKEKYSFEFIKVDNISKEELFSEIQKADLIIDQMLTGFYGVFAVESMLLEKPVVCYIRNDIWNNIKHDCPVINANPDTLHNVLENILNNKETLYETGKSSRVYALKHHSPENAARYILSEMNKGNKI